MTQPASDAIYLAAMLLIGRLYYRGDAPLGIAGGFDLGGVYVRSRDPDIQALLIGRHQGIGLDPAQTWPTLAQVKDRWDIDASVDDARITEVIAAVTDHLTEVLTDGFGVA